MHKVHIDHRADLARQRMEKVKRKLLVMGNKGGVGKSTVAAAFAHGLAARGLKTGLLDADIHGPSAARLTGAEGLAHGLNDGIIEPVEAAPNLRMVSLGSVMKDTSLPLIWRGPVKNSVLKQLVADVNWGPLDWLVIDAPPGTGDEPLTVCQLIPGMTGAVVVTTGQELALLDSVKAVNFLKKLGVPVLGILENMTEFCCPHCGGKVDLFRTGGARKAAAELSVPFLGSVPFDPALVPAADAGRAFSGGAPGSPAAAALAAALDGLIGAVDGGGAR